MPDDLPVIALTMGDPAGIGPEVVLKALADPALAGVAQWVVVGDARAIGRRRFWIGATGRE